MIQLGMGLLVVCGVALLAALCLGIWQLAPHEKQVPSTIDWPPTWEEIRAERGIIEQRHVEEPPAVTGEWALPVPVKNHRHNLHCAKCGRFAKVVPGWPGVSECKHHGLTARLVFVPDTVPAELEESFAILSSVS